MEDLEDFEEALQIDEHALDDAIQQQPDLQWRIGDAVALWVSRRDAAKQDLEILEAETENKIRRTWKDEKRITDKEVESLKRTDKQVIEAEKTLLELKHIVSRWQAMKEAIEQRSFAMRQLVDLYTASYFTSSGAVKGSGDLREVDAQRARKAREAAPLPFDVRKKGKK